MFVYSSVYLLNSGSLSHTILILYTLVRYNVLFFKQQGKDAMPNKAKGVDVLLSIRDVLKGAQIFEHVELFTTLTVSKPNKLVEKDDADDFEGATEAASEDGHVISGSDQVEGESVSPDSCCCCYFRAWNGWFVYQWAASQGNVFIIPVVMMEDGEAWTITVHARGCPRGDCVT